MLLILNLIRRFRIIMKHCGSFLIIVATEEILGSREIYYFGFYYHSMNIVDFSPCYHLILRSLNDEGEENQSP